MLATAGFGHSKCFSTTQIVGIHWSSVFFSNTDPDTLTQGSFSLIEIYGNILTV